LIYRVNQYLHQYLLFLFLYLGYGNSSLPVIQETAAAQWLTRLIRALRLSNFVIISPSMSGRFALPYIMQSNAKQRSVRGFVPIALVGTKNFDTTDYKQITVSRFLFPIILLNLLFIKIPTLIVHGENDTKFHSAILSLKQIPSSEVLTIKNASHACYIEQPIIFHNSLRQFLYTIYRPIYIEQYKQRSVSLNLHSSVSSSSVKINRTKLNGKEGKKVTGNSTANEEQQHLH
jgi:pimeloyl-ACP methyl ester carboxylesterase